MKVYMLKDVESVGMAGQIIKVSEGYARNFLIPRKLAAEINATNESFYAAKIKKQHLAAEAITTKMGMLAERIRHLKVTLRKRVHDDGKLYGSVSADEIVDLLSQKEIPVSKKQVVFGKTVKAIGEHRVGIKLSSKLIPEFTLTVSASAE